MAACAFALLLALTCAVRAAACPHGCECRPSVTRCIADNAADVPATRRAAVLDLRLTGQRRILHGDALGQRLSLRSLLLHHNGITVVEDGAFRRLSHLANLYLYSNKITQLTGDTLAGLKLLENLHLYDNEIATISPDAFRHSPNLRRIYLNKNRLQRISAQTFWPLQHLQVVRIDKNPWLCDCQLSAFGKFLRRADLESIDSRALCEAKLSGSGERTAVVDFVASDCTDEAAESQLVDVDYGGTVQLKCKASARQVANVIWLHNGTLLQPVDSKYRLLAGGRLQIVNSSFEQDGVYECVDEDEGERSAPLRLRLRRSTSPPRFTLRPRNTLIAEGQRLRLHCQASGEPPPNIAWLKDGRPLRATRQIQLSGRNDTLTVYPITRAQSGRYTCRASNRFGDVITKADVRVSYSTPPRIVHAPRSLSVRAGATAAFRCKADGTPAPFIDWIFNGSPVPTVRGHFQLSDDRTELKVNDVRARDAGQYSCVAGNDVGGIQADATLSVEQQTASLDHTLIAEVIRESVRQATHNVDRAINATRRDLYDGRAKSPSELLALFRFPGPAAVELARAREIYEETLVLVQRHVRDGLMLNASDDADADYASVLSVSHLQMIMELSGCTPAQFKNPCSDMCFHLKYRSYDGQCNNLGKPMIGAGLTPFKRLLPPIYENGFNTPVGWNSDKLYYGFRKPNARAVSLQVLSSARISADPDYSAMLMQWGQFIDHDIDFAAAAPSRETFASGAVCNRTCANRAPCFNIAMPADDPRLAGRRADQLPCIEFERSSAVCGSGQTSVIFERITPRQQLNLITSYLDGSQIYGGSEGEALDLRDLYSDHGQLRYDIVSHRQKPYLPFNRDAPMDCRRNLTADHPIRCFLAGDYRANEQLGLLSMHTLFLREHNRIASHLLTVNPHWDGETIYQESRKIIGALLQHITYAAWLPKVLGPEGMRLLGEDGGYDNAEDATVANAFATAAFRFGHVLVNPTLHRLDASFEPVAQGPLPLHEAFFAPERLLSEGGIDPLLRGLIGAPMKEPRADQLISRELTERLFSRAHHVALDLAALNMQRGRDHALPGYTAWRRFCNLSAPNNWQHMEALIPDAVVRTKLRRLYGHPANVDLWVGGIAERSLPGAKVGPTFACIIADQFRRLRAADRFFYTHQNAFTALQLTELRKASLARILCDNGDEIGRVSEDVFRYSTNRSVYVPCEQIPRLNLNLWQECCSSGCSGTASYAESDEPEESGQSLERRRLRRRAAEKAPGHQIKALQQRIRQLEAAVKTLVQRDENKLGI